MNRFICLLLLAAAVAWPGARARAGAIVTVAPDGNGLSVDGGGTMTFELGLPVALDAAGGEIHRLIEQSAELDGYALRYVGGGRAGLKITPEDTITFQASGFGADVKSVSLALHIRFAFIDGGRWHFDDAPPAAFPAAQPPRPFIFDAAAKSFVITGEDGRGLRFDLPPYTYNQLADDRTWGTRGFTWKMFVPLHSNQPTLRWKVGAFQDAAAAAARTPAYDRFGQSARADWPGKLHDESELAADAAGEAAYYAGFHPPARDACGGLPDSGETLGLAKTGFFHVQQAGGRWFLVDPEGNAFFHLGPCCFSPINATWIGGREAAFAWIPPRDGSYATAYPLKGEPESLDFYNANLIRKYGRPVDAAEFSRRMIQRVRCFGFNSAGCFSAPPDRDTWPHARFPYVLKLPCDPWEGYWYLPGNQRIADPFDERLQAQFDKMCAAALPPHADDPYLIGYYNDNEPIYQDIAKVVAALPGSRYSCKRKLVDMLRGRYHGEVAAFNRAWQMTAGGFDELLEPGLPITTPAATADMQAFTELFLRTYYEWNRAELRKYDKQHLLLGSRLQPATINHNEPLCRLMGEYLDVISYNYYTDRLDPDLLRRIHAWTGDKPMLLSEFDYTSSSDSGLPGGNKGVGSQEDRGRAYREYIEQAAALGFVIGAEWFTLVDQPASGTWWGRYDGECANTGLFSIVDRPWKPLVEQMAQTNFAIYNVLLGRKAPFTWQDRPPGRP